MSKTSCSILKTVWKDQVKAIKGRKLKSSHSKLFKCYCPPKIDIFAPISPAQRQMPFLTVKTADSDLENLHILKPDKMSDLTTDDEKGRSDHGKGSLAPVQGNKT